MKVFEGRLITVEVEDGLEIVRHPGAAAVVAVDSEQRVVLVRQERPAVDRTLLELPAGKLDPGEEPLAAAKRELREETGLHGGEWTAAGSFFTSPGFADERMYVFVATGLAEGDASPESDEELELVRVPVRDVPALLGEIEDAKTLAGLLLFLR